MKHCCECGAFEAHLPDDLAKRSTRLICHCKHCQAFARHLGKSDAFIGADGAVDLVQLAPKDWTVISGLDQLVALKLTDKGPMRWYSKCCNTPICNTLEKRFPPFLSLMRPNIKADGTAVGPPVGHVFCDHLSDKPEPNGAKVLMKLGAAFLSRMIMAGLSGSYKATPLFDADTGEPIQTAHRLSQEARTAAYCQAE